MKKTEGPGYVFAANCVNCKYLKVEHIVEHIPVDDNLEECLSEYATKYICDKGFTLNSNGPSTPINCSFYPQMIRHAVVDLLSSVQDNYVHEGMVDKLAYERLKEELKQRDGELEAFLTKLAGVL